MKPEILVLIWTVKPLQGIKLTCLVHCGLHRWHTECYSTDWISNCQPEYSLSLVTYQQHPQPDLEFWPSSWNVTRSEKTHDDVRMCWVSTLDTCGKETQCSLRKGAAYLSLKTCWSNKSVLLSFRVKSFSKESLFDLRPWSPQKLYRWQKIDRWGFSRRCGGRITTFNYICIMNCGVSSLTSLHDTYSITYSGLDSAVEESESK